MSPGRLGPWRRLPAWLALALVAAAAAAGLLSFRLVQRERIIASERLALTRQAESLAAELRRQIITTNQIMEGVVEAWENLSTSEVGKRQLDWLLTHFAQALNGVRTLAVLDDQGRVLASNQATIVGVDLRGREYFQLASSQPDPKRLYLAAPYASVLDTQELSLGRAIVERSGRFAGLVVASLDSEELGALLEGLRFAPAIKARIRHSAGAVWVERPASEPAASAGGAQLAGEGRAPALALSVPVWLGGFPTDAGLSIECEWDLSGLLGKWAVETRNEALWLAVFIALAVLLLAVYQGWRARTWQRVTRAENLLADQRAEFESFFDLSLDLLCIANQQGRFLRVNQAWSAVLGYRLAELEGRPFMELVHPEDQASTLDAMAALAEGKQVSGFVNRYRAQDGGYRFIEWRSVPAPNGLVYAAARDITQSRENERHLAESQAKLSHILNELPLATCLIAEDGLVYYRNRRFLALLGHDAEAAPSLDRWAALVFPDPLERARFAERWRQDIASARQAGSDLPGREYLLRSAFGQDLNIEISGIVLGADILATFVDQTARRRYEEDLVAHRELAEQASLAKSEFLASMSHEIRTPMHAILGLTRLVLEMELGPVQADLLRKSQGAAQTLLGLLNDILDFSKVEAGRLELECRPVRLRQLLEDNCQLFEAQAARKGLGFRRELPAELPEWLSLDGLRLSQVLRNLLDNAIKFTDQGEIALSVARLPDPGPRVSLEFAVSDTGIGMDEAEQARLFKAFSQADSSISRRFGGSGLGLAISQRLVGLMGSAIELSSRPGQGSRFAFRLALEPAEPGAADLAGSGSLPPLRLAGMRVLLVEDNPLNQEVAGEFLRRRGVDLQVVGSGPAALELVPNGGFDLVLMDLHMPGMDGYETTRRLRTLPAGRDLPVVAMTAAVLPEDRARCAASGMVGFVAKPVDPDELIGVLLGIVSGGGPGGGEAGPGEPRPLDATDRPAPPEALSGQAGAPGPGAELRLDQALQRLGGKREFLASLLAEFMDGLDGQLGRMAQAQAAARWDELLHEAHSAKGAAANLGLAGFAGALAAAEAAAKARRPAELESLGRLAAETRSRVQDWLQSAAEGTAPS